MPLAASLPPTPTKGTVQSVPSIKYRSYAGDISHGDWGIEEIALEKDGDAEEKMVSSSDEYCVDSEEDRGSCRHGSRYVVGRDAVGRSFISIKLHFNCILF